MKKAVLYDIHRTIYHGEFKTMAVFTFAMNQGTGDWGLAFEYSLTAKDVNLLERMS